MTSENFCDTLLKKANVAIVPGTALAEAARVCTRLLCNIHGEPRKAVERIERFLKTL
jgi:aspartate/methionine/tyrosine aminotransferase